MIGYEEWSVQMMMENKTAAAQTSVSSIKSVYLPGKDDGLDDVFRNT